MILGLFLVVDKEIDARIPSSMRCHIVFKSHILGPDLRRALVKHASEAFLALVPLVVIALELLVLVRLRYVDILSLIVIIWVSGSMLDHKLVEQHPERPFLLRRVEKLAINTSWAHPLVLKLSSANLCLVENWVFDYDCLSRIKTSHYRMLWSRVNLHRLFSLSSLLLTRLRLSKRMLFYLTFQFALFEN